VDANTNNVSRWKRFRYQLEAVAVEALAWLMPRLPYGLVRRLGTGLGFLGYYLLAKERRIALANLDVAFGSTKSQAEKERIARVSFQNFASTLLKLFWAPHLTRIRLEEIVEANVDRLACIKGLSARGKGVLFVTLHFGDWELLSLATGLYGMPLNVVTETMRNTALERVFVRLRTLTGHRIVPQRSAALKIYKSLKRGETVAVLIDLNAPEETGGLWLEFFGLPVFNNVSVAALALRSGAAIIGCYAHPLPDGRLKVVYGPELAYTPTGDYETDVRIISQQCLTFCEQTIREHPEFWLWSYKRWKHRRDAGDTRYPFYTSSVVLPARKPTQVSA
jgi:Kdo2-lipid IVA lauroyltransferase/acyltransferase